MGALFAAPFVAPLLSCDPFVFYETDKGFIFPLVEIAAKSKLEIGRQIPLAGMFELLELSHNKVRVGYLFKTSFSVINGGAYLVTFLKNKGLAEAYEVLLKLDTLVIYNFQNRGTLAISPKVSNHLERILDNQ